jgi:cysteine desulfurase
MARSSLRFSLGRYTTDDEIDYTIEKVTVAMNRLKEINTHFEK